MLETLATLNKLAKEVGICEVSQPFFHSKRTWVSHHFQPSLLNFCVTDGATVVATRYISSKQDEAASLVCYDNSNLFNDD